MSLLLCYFHVHAKEKSLNTICSTKHMKGACLPFDFVAKTGIIRETCKRRVLLRVGDGSFSSNLFLNLDIILGKSLKNFK